MQALCSRFLSSLYASLVRKQRYLFIALCSCFLSSSVHRSSPQTTIPFLLHCARVSCPHPYTGRKVEIDVKGSGSVPYLQHETLLPALQSKSHVAFRRISSIDCRTARFLRQTKVHTSHRPRTATYASSTRPPATISSFERKKRKKKKKKKPHAC